MYNKLELNIDIKGGQNNKIHGTPRRPSRPNSNVNAKTPPRPSPRTTKIGTVSSKKAGSAGYLNSPQLNNSIGDHFDLTKFSSFNSTLLLQTSTGNDETRRYYDQQLSPSWSETIDETRREESEIKIMRD